MNFKQIGVMCFAAIILLSGCADESRMTNLRIQINEKADKLSEAKEKLSYLKAEAESLNQEVRTLANEKDSLAASLAGLKNRHPVITGCIISSAAGLLAVKLLADSANIKTEDAVKGTVCAMAMFHDDYPYVRSALRDLDAAAATIDAKLSTANANYKSKEEEVERYSNDAYQLAREVEYASEALRCERNLFCKMKSA